ncbi:MAG: Hemoglobin-like protein [Steroidobacteraceae bacterium]|nr:Hemoglobin-like protein [Steroidobacteraceae bacterium]
MGIDDSAFNALVDDLVMALDKFDVQEKEKGELLALLGPMKGDIVER